MFSSPAQTAHQHRASQYIDGSTYLAIHSCTKNRHSVHSSASYGSSMTAVLYSATPYTVQPCVRDAPAFHTCEEQSGCFVSRACLNLREVRFIMVAFAACCCKWNKTTFAFRPWAVVVVDEPMLSHGFSCSPVVCGRVLFCASALSTASCVLRAVFSDLAICRIVGETEQAHGTALRLACGGHQPIACRSLLQPAGWPPCYRCCRCRGTSGRSI